jgi:AcrR family transcriptional regulator
VTKDAARRDTIIDALADHVLAAGLAGSSIRPLAKAAGLSDRMLLYHFRDKAEALGAAADRIGERLTAKLTLSTGPDRLPFDALRIRLATLMMDDDVWPYTRLWLEVVSGAAHGDAFCRETAARLGAGFLAWGGMQLDCNDADRTRLAAQLLAAIDGLFILKAAGMDAAVSEALKPAV